ncbi:MAG TPA: 7-carboxy-7-deazaguanine synthase QueE [Chitinophagaceae bacterium]|nr:7-carboxy-7-deazaguanine synthase QueE [Chitinophagaceae bacterium]
MMKNTITQSLPVMESFYTIQGEGYHQGKAAYFIRLGGCDVGCVWCDVKESWDAGKHPKFSVEEIVNKAKEETKNIKQKKSNNEVLTNSYRLLATSPIVVITGGEPLMHDLDTLTQALRAEGFKTNIETSGSYPISGEWDWICLSPKKFKKPLDEICLKANELKVVIFNKHDFIWAEEYEGKVSPDCKLYLQPEWDKATEMTPLIIDYIKTHPQWELSLQIHKYIHVP